MNPTKPKKKFIASLPSDFQEVLMTTELEISKGLNVPILRKLVYLYTTGMEYYDLVHKEKFREFYSDKLVNLLTRKDVEKFLDKNPINFDDKGDLDLLFSSKNQNTDDKKAQRNNENNNIINEIDNEMYDFSHQVRKNSITLVKKKVTDFDIGLIIKRKLLEVNANLNKIDQALSNEMIEQMSEFEENKRKRKIMKSGNNNSKINGIIKSADINNKKEIQEDKNSDTNSISSPSSNDEESHNIIKSTEDELKILELSGINTPEKNKSTNDEKNEKPNNSGVTPTKNLIGNNPMLREIEDYAQKNMNEMYQAFEELKASFQEEIKEAEENGFTDIADGLKEDLQTELDNLKDQYEEQKRVEIEKIKAKYSKRNVLL